MQSGKSSETTKSSEVSTLPDAGTPERRVFEQKALREGRHALEARGDQIEQALYDVYMHFRVEFIERYGLMDTAPRSSVAWDEALADAEALREHVRQRWARAIFESYR